MGLGNRARLDVINEGHTSIMVRAHNMTGGTTYKRQYFWKYKKVGSSGGYIWDNESSPDKDGDLGVTDKYYLYEGLEPGTEYEFYVEAHGNTKDYEGWVGSLGGYGSVVGTTKAYDAGLSMEVRTGDVTKNSIPVRIYGMDSDNPNRRMYVLFYKGPGDTEWIEYDRFKDQDSGVTEKYLTFEGMYAGTTYQLLVNVYGSTGDYTGYIGDAQCSEKTKDPIKPKQWSWTSSNGQASADVTEKAYNALVNKDSLTKFSRDVWNDFLTLLNKGLVMASIPWDMSGGLSYSDALMNYGKGGNVLTAERFNSVRVNVDQLCSTGMTDVSTGDLVMGWYFTKFADSYNEWAKTAEF